MIHLALFDIAADQIEGEQHSPGAAAVATRCQDLHIRAGRWTVLRSLDVDARLALSLQIRQVSPFAIQKVVRHIHGHLRGQMHVVGATEDHLLDAAQEIQGAGLDGA